MEGGSFCGVEVGTREMKDENEVCHQQSFAEPFIMQTSCSYTFSRYTTHWARTAKCCGRHLPVRSRVQTAAGRKLKRGETFFFSSTEVIMICFQPL